MPRKCKACAHPQLDDINQDIVKGEIYREIARRYGLSKDIVYRHRCEHMATM